MGLVGLFTYDCLLNLAQEVDLIWSRPFHFTTVFYLIMRYSSFINLLFNLGATHLAMTNLNGTNEVVSLSACLHCLTTDGRIL